MEYQLPDYTLAPTVLDPTASLWESLYKLVTCFKPDVYWRRERRALLLADPLAGRLYDMGSLHLTAAAVVGGMIA